MKGGNIKPASPANGCEDIVIQDNTVFHAHGGFVLGSETISGMRRIIVRHNRFAGTDTGLRFKSGMSRGGKTEKLFISDIMMTDIKDEAIIFQCDYVDRPAGSDPNKVPTFTEEQRRRLPISRTSISRMSSVMEPPRVSRQVVSSVSTMCVTSTSRTPPLSIPIPTRRLTRRQQSSISRTSIW